MITHITELTKNKRQSILNDIRLDKAMVSNNTILSTDMDDDTEYTFEYMDADEFFARTTFSYENGDEQGSFFVTVDFTTIEGEEGVMTTGFGGERISPDDIEANEASFKIFAYCDNGNHFIELLFETKELGSYIYETMQELKEVA